MFHFSFSLKMQAIARLPSGILSIKSNVPLLVRVVISVCMAADHWEASGAEAACFEDLGSVTICFGVSCICAVGMVVALVSVQRTAKAVCPAGVFTVSESRGTSSRV